MSSKALGLGTGTYVSRANGLDIDFELERIVDEEGNQIQETSHQGSRPFNKVELDKMNRIGTCIACHGSDSEFWKVPGRPSVIAAPTDELHRKTIRKILRKAGE